MMTRAGHLNLGIEFSEFSKNHPKACPYGNSPRSVLCRYPTFFSQSASVFGRIQRVNCGRAMDIWGFSTTAEGSPFAKTLRSGGNFPIPPCLGSLPNWSFMPMAFPRDRIIFRLWFAYAHPGIPSPSCRPRNRLLLCLEGSSECLWRIMLGA